MGNLHLFTLSVLLAIVSSSAHNFDLGRDDPNPPVSFTTYPPGRPTLIPEPDRQLSPGQRFARPEDNPFYRPGALVYGPPKIAEFKDFTEPLPLFFNQTCRNGGGTLQERWGKHHYDVLHRNGTVQPVGFSLDIFKELELSNTTIFSEITKAQYLVYSNDTKHESRDLDKRYVIGPDGRREILNTWVFPIDTVGGVASGCTGTLVGPHHVLTAGHCVHSGGSSGNWFGNLNFTLTFRPGFDGKTISTQTFDWSLVWSVKGWTEHADWDYDYALIILQDTETSFPWMSFGYDTDIDDGWIVNSNGFHGDKPANTMWHTDDVITDTDDNHFDHNLDIIKGASGSGVYAFFPSDGSRIIYGIQSTQWTETVINFPDFWNTHTNIGNRATRINKTRFWLICSWINAGIC